MQKIAKLCVLFFAIGCTSFHAQAMFARRSDGQKEKKAKFAQCEKLFYEFVCSEKFETIFKNIIFDENKCRQILFNGNNSNYKDWLNIEIQHGLKKDGKYGEKSYMVTLKEALGKARAGDFFFKEKTKTVDVIIKKLPLFFYEDFARDFYWYSLTKFDNGDSICLCGFIEILTRLLRPKFYFEVYNEDFAIRCRIFVVVYFSLMLAYTADIQKEVGFVANMFMKDQ